jgi:hypothetical protein
MLMVQLEFAGTGTLVLQVLLLWMGKSLKFVPWMVMLEIGSAVLPALKNVTVFAGLVVPTVCAAKVNAVGVTETAVALPVSLTACCPFPGEKLPKTFRKAISLPLIVGW